MTDSQATIAVPLTQLGLLQVRGADAAAFLQGQLSNDVRRLSPVQAQLSSYNSPKGRMLAVLHVFATGEGFLLELHRGVLEAVLKRLRMHMLRSKVELAEATDRALLGLAGPRAAEVLETLGLPAPSMPLACAWKDDVCVTRRLGEAPRYTLLVSATAVAAWQERLGAHAAAADLDAWKLAELEAGVPTVYPQTQDHFVAQMCNLEALGGISFEKGCYTGQEVIARVHYRGAVKRHMTLQRLEGAAPAPGTKLEAGEVVDAVALGEGGAAALLVMRSEG